MQRKRVAEQRVTQGNHGGAKRGEANPQRRQRGAGRWAAMALVSIAALGASGASGCGDTADSVGAGEGHESIDEATDALKTQKLCVKLKPSDSMISSEQPAKTFGASAFALSGPSTGGLAHPLHALFSFDTSVVPATATVLSASLSLRQTNNGAGTATAHLISGSWSEATVTWNSLGGAFNPVSFKSFSTATAIITVNLLPQVQAWVDGSVPNNGFLIKETDGFLAKYYTKEWSISSQRPVLDVCYEVNCAAGFADCNNDPSDGCEADLASAGSCGACGNVCANGACFGGACVECLTSATCPGNACVNGFCGNSPQCADGMKNGQETGTDCGGAVCPACASGKGCNANSDCQSGKCTAGVCTDVLLLGELQSRGSNGGNDELVEIYNPMNIAAVFDATWTVSARSAVGTCASNATAQRFAGGGQTIPPHGHLLYVNNNTNSYDGPKAGDGTYSSGFLDASSVMLNHGGAVVDAVCFYFDQTTLNNLKTCGTPYVCEGQPVSNLPHANFSQASENVDVSLERKPGGAAGNGTDTNDNSADFVGNTPANPQNLASPSSPCVNCAACVVPTDCPGVDTECSVRSCYGGVCEHAFTAAGTVTVAQTSGDCHANQCDGLGNVVSVTDNADLPNDNNQCTTDACNAGAPSNVATVSGTACNQNGGARCNGSGTCVQCLAAADCGASTDCATWSCVNNTCQGSFAAAGTVTSTQVTGDCKNNQCDGAGNIVNATDDADLPNDNKQCTSDTCTAGAPSFTPIASGTACNQNGGVVCDGVGGCVQCLSSADCSGGAACSNGVCAQPIILLISQIQTRGSNGGNDEFVEIYNPTSAPITFDNTWTVSARSAVGACAGNAEALRFTGSGQVIGPHKHLLFINSSASGYNGAVSGDATYSVGIVDAASVVLRKGAVVMDAMCFYFNVGTQSSLTGCATPFICEGAPISNLPHDNTTAGLSNSDASLERKPGGAGGNTVDTGVTLNDFFNVASAVPHNLSSAPTP